MNEIKKYNYNNIYLKQNVKKVPQTKCDEIIGTIYHHYKGLYNGVNTIENLSKYSQDKYTNNFRNWIVKYSCNKYRPLEFKNLVIYDLKNPQDYKQAIVDYISGMTDKYAIKTYESIKSKQ